MTEFEKALELKPCPNPWCEGRETYQDEHSAGVMVRCAKCDLKGPPRPTEAEAAAAWNTRPTHKAAPVSDGVVERARELLAEIHEIAGNKPAAFTLRNVGIVGTVFEQQAAAIECALSGLDEARREAFEEAAKVAETAAASHADLALHGEQEQARLREAMEAMATKLAQQIRRL